MTENDELRSHPVAPTTSNQHEQKPKNWHIALVCLIGHPAMHEGELREVADGYDYIGIDERNLPIALADEETGILYSIHTSEQALLVTLGMEYFLHCLRNRLQLHRRRECAA